MNTDAITERIIQDAQAGAARLLKETGEKAGKIREASDARIEEMRGKALEQAARDGEELHTRMLRMAELDLRKALLGMKREVIDQAFCAVIVKMRNMPDDQARSYLTRLLLDSAEGDEAIIVSEQDAHLYSADFLREVNEKLLKLGRKGALTLSAERREMKGGFVLSRGGVEINCAFDAVVGQLRPSLEAETANALFQ